MAQEIDYRDGTDLILSVGGQALGHSTGCKISYKAETGSRKTKEARTGKWEEKYVKTLGVTITADGFVHAKDGNNNLPSLLALFKEAKPVDASWDYRDGGGSHSCKCIITALDDEGKAGDDETYSITLENSGPLDDAGEEESTAG